MRGRPVYRAALALGAASIALAAVPAAQAKTVTYRFFEKTITDRFYGPDGNPAPVPTTGAPAAGSRAVQASDDYVGNHARHAKTATASDHIECTFTDALGDATCSGQIAIGGSMLLADDVKVNFGPGSPVVPLNGGTGIFKHAHGTATSVSVGNTNNSDFTVKVAY